jgi:hypothetical protein
MAGCQDPAAEAAISERDSHLTLIARIDEVHD